MKLNNFTKRNYYSLYVTLLSTVFLVSCGTYQSVYTNDGIYNDEPIEERIDDPKTAIKSPIVGTAYLSQEPGAKPFASVGKKIKKDDTVMIIEAMKTMNHVPSPINGTIKKICIEDGQPVEYGKVLVLLD